VSVFLLYLSFVYAAIEINFSMNKVDYICVYQNSGSAASPVLSTSPETQFNVAFNLLRQQLRQRPTTSAHRSVTRTATESLLLAALGLADAGTDSATTGAVEGPLSPDAGSGLTADMRRYKTELCRAYEERGQCRYGERCQFAHGMGELRALQRHPKYKTELCRTYHTSGYCPYGARCHFVHNATTPPAPPPTPRDVECCLAASQKSSSVSAGYPVPDNIQLSLLSAALEKHASLTATAACKNVSIGAHVSIIEQLYSSTSDREKRKKTVYNKHQYTIDMQIIKRSLMCGLKNKL